MSENSNCNSLSFVNLNVYGSLEEKLKNCDFKNLINNHDFISLSECWINKKSSINLEGYEKIVKCRKRLKKARRDSGGIAVYYRKNLSSGVKEINWDFEDGVIFKLCKDFFNLQNDIYVLIPYMRPVNSSRCNVDTGIDIFDILSNKLAELTDLGDIILMGDFNARTGTLPDYAEFEDKDDHHSNYNIPVIPFTNNKIFKDDIVAAGLTLQRKNTDKSTNEYGTKLLNLCKMANILILNGRSPGDVEGNLTSCNHRGSSTIDYIGVSKNIIAYDIQFNIGSFNEHTDHAPLFFKLQNLNCCFCSNKTNNVQCKPKWQNINEDKYVSEMNSKDVNDIISEMINSCELENLTSDVAENMLCKLCDLMLPVCNQNSHCIIDNNVQKNNLQNQDWYDNDCKEARLIFKNYEEKFRYDRSVENRTHMVYSRNQYRKLCRLKYRNKRKSDAKYLEALSKSNPKKFWNKLKRKNKFQHGNCDFKEYFKEQGKFETFLSNEKETEVNNWDNHCNFSDNPELDREITLDELIANIKLLKCGKASGPDNILNEFMKYSNHNTKLLLLKLFNFFFDHSYFPDQWAKSEIIPIYKKGDINICSNYRGISLLSCMAKLFTGIINRRLNTWAEENDIFNKFQFGFRTNKSTTDCLFLLQSAIDHCLSNGAYIYCAFIDFKQAFDSINRKAMWFKLHSNMLSGKIIRILKSMYGKMKMYVKDSVINNCYDSNDGYFSCTSGVTNSRPIVNNCHDSNDDYFSCTSGVMQGDSVSPFLFSMFLNDLENDLSKCDQVGLKFKELIVNLLLFADDMVLFSNTKKGLQNGLQGLEKYCDDWGLTVNIEKTKCMVFKKGGKIGKLDKWSYKGEPLETVKHFKYLGFILSSSGSFSKGISDLAIRGNRALFGLKKIIHENPYMSVDIQINLFHSLVESVMSYSCEIWGFKEAEELEKIHIGFLKSILGVRKSTPSAYIYTELGAHPLSLKRTERIINYWFKILNLENSNPIKKMYNILLDDVNEGLSTSNWVYLIKDLLFKLGFGYAWFQQEILDQKMFFSEFKLRLEDTNKQNLNEKLSETSDNRLFKRLNPPHDFKNYLADIDEKHKRIALSKVRLGSHNFFIERGRWSKKKVSERLCLTCNILEDEYHIFIECSKFSSLRKQYLPKSLTKSPSMYTFLNHINNLKKKDLSNFSTFCYKVLKIYDQDI